MELVAVARRPLLSAVRHDFLASAVVFDETIAVLPVKILLHRGFHPFDAAVIKVGKSNNVTKHRAIRVDARGVMLEINSAQIAGTKSFTQDLCGVFGHFPLDHDVTAPTV